MPDPHEALHKELSDRYELEGVLGEGGMGTVYLARDRKHDRRVAIKTIHPNRTNEEVRQRFQREIGITAQLQHPHILPLLDSGAAGETLYYVMPCVEGESLQRRLERDGRLSVDEAIRIARDVAEALQHAHERHVIHRDIKPSNIMLTAGHAVVMDFGIAKAMSEDTGGGLTQTGFVIGSPAYMSPEQATGERPVDGRSDIYSLGCVLYEMLTGEPPFTGSTPLELIARSVREEAPSLRSQIEDVSPALEEVVHRSMAKAPDKRFQTADAFAEALSEAQSIPVAEDGSPATSARRPMWPRLRDTRLLQVLIAYLSVSFILLEAAALFTDQLGLPAWVFPGALAILALGLPVLFVTAIVQSVGMSGISQRHQRWFTWRRVIGSGVVALAVWGLIVAGYMTMRTLGIGPAAPLIARGLLEERERIVIADFANHAPDSLLGGAVTEAFRVDLTQSPSIRLMAPDQMREAINRMQREPGGLVDLEFAREVAVREGVKAVIGGEINTLGSAYVLSVKLVSAQSGEELAAYRETAEDRTGIIGAVDRLSKRLRAKIGESLASIRQSRPLPSVTTSSLEALELYARAQELSRRGDLVVSIPLFEQAVALDTTFAGGYRALGIAYANVGNPGASRRNTELAYRFSERLPERERYRTRAIVQVGRGRPDSAAYYYRLLLESPYDTVVAMNNLGDVYERMGRYQEALELYRRSVRAGPDRIAGYVNVASAARTLGLHELADSALSEMVERFPPGPNQALVEASNAYYAGDIARLEEIATSWAEAPISDGDSRAGGRHLLAGLAGMRGKPREAMALADSAARLYVEDGSFSWAYSAVEVLNHAAWAANPESALPYLAPLLEEFRSAEALLTAPRFKHQALGLFAAAYALAGEHAVARALLAGADSLAALSDFQPAGATEHARAILALREGRPDESLQHLEFARAAEYGLMHNYSQLLLGDVYLALGRLPEAAAELEAVAGTANVFFGDTRAHPPLQPVAHERLGRLYLVLGDTTAALTHLAAFVELWSHADPALQPRVQKAQRTLQEILSQRG
jgi:tetratricopeptide (TPR) repeat protein/tRNA A-37 threonylcarbamoyl transferase component Bud32